MRNNEYDISIFIKELEDLGLSLSPLQIDQFLTYYEILLEWNSVMNLTTITDFDEVISKHFIDSLSLIKIIDLNQIKKVIDVGTGAGFPGIPLKIVFPHLEILLLDSLNKRINFLNTIVEQLKLENISAVHGRAEEMAMNKIYRESYDLCVSRAVANLSTLSELCLPFVKVKGYFVSYKGDVVREELDQAKHAIFLMGGKIEKREDFVLPGTDFNRSLIKIIKQEPTSKKYPRKAGTPSRSPLK